MYKNEVNKVETLLGQALSFVCVADDSTNLASPKTTPADKKVVCYFTSWSQGRKSPYNFTPDNMDAFACTHIIYAFATFGQNYNLAPSDPEADINKSELLEIESLKRGIS